MKQQDGLLERRLVLEEVVVPAEEVVVPAEEVVAREEEAFGRGSAGRPAVLDGSLWMGS